VTIPPQIRQMLERPINELCARADDRYRKTARRMLKDQKPDVEAQARGRTDLGSPLSPAEDTALALRAAAMQAGEYEAFRRIVAVLRQQAPGTAKALGLHR
jgi:hypothetical protein